MPKFVAAFLLAGLLVGCGPAPRSDPDPRSNQLQLVVGNDSIELEAGQTLLVQLLVIGASSDQATISSPDLPPFAMLEGKTLTIAPSREYQGRYAMTLVASTATSSTSAVLTVNVTRFNTPPTVMTMAPATFVADVNGFRLVCPSPSCTVYQSAAVYVLVGDADGDAVTVDLEVVPEGQAFTGTPTTSVTSPVGILQNARCGGNYDATHVCMEVPLPQLEPGRFYTFALRVRDALGAVGTWPYWEPVTDGWAHETFWEFEQGPCTDHQCACEPSPPTVDPAMCEVDADCCSGACVNRQCQ